MRLLLDTHVFLWYITADPCLPAAFLTAIREPANEVYLSDASVWEAVVKHALGKLPLPAPPAAYLPHQRAAHGIAPLPVDEGAIPTWPDCRHSTATPSTACWSPRLSSTG
ncbi:MAG: type II toxin-antitoxin system VapC family toxin [Gemmataceae bacterium]